ncbi:MAG: glycosyltransferase, partial [Leptolyngbyaceae cyanobacterium bins.59]|nr:glycosyltransferase [Leptolyngbyaceae cyanobacterium bins.59]
ASLFVFPSLYEGFGLPPLEAMQCGVPVIAANTTSIPEVVGDAALLVDPLNSEEMAQKIAQVLQEPSLAQMLRERGLARAKQFSWSRCAEQVAQVYRRAVQEKRDRS